MRNNSSGRKDFSSGMGEDRKNGLFGMRIQNGLEFSKTCSTMTVLKNGRMEKSHE